jgi:hypothetical protein
LALKRWGKTRLTFQHEKVQQAPGWSQHLHDSLQSLWHQAIHFIFLPATFTSGKEGARLNDLNDSSSSKNTDAVQTMTNYMCLARQVLYHLSHSTSNYVSFFLRGGGGRLGLNSELCTCKAGAPLLEPLL